MTINFENILNILKEIKCYNCNCNLELKKNNYNISVLCFCQCKLFCFFIDKQSYEYFIQPICYDDNKNMLMYNSILYLDSIHNKIYFSKMELFCFTEENCNLEFNKYITYNNLENLKSNIYSALVAFCKCKNNLIFK